MRGLARGGNRQTSQLLVAHASIKQLQTDADQLLVAQRSDPKDGTQQLGSLAGVPVHVVSDLGVGKV